MQTEHSFLRSKGTCVFCRELGNYIFKQYEFTLMVPETRCVCGGEGENPEIWNKIYFPYSQEDQTFIFFLPTN